MRPSEIRYSTIRCAAWCEWVDGGGQTSLPRIYMNNCWLSIYYLIIQRLPAGTNTSSASSKLGKNFYEPRSHTPNRGEVVTIVFFMSLL